MGEVVFMDTTLEIQRRFHQVQQFKTFYIASMVCIAFNYVLSAHDNHEQNVEIDDNTSMITSNAKLLDVASVRGSIIGLKSNNLDTLQQAHFGGNMETIMQSTDSFDFDMLGGD